MDLKTYLRTLPDDKARRAFARRCKTSLAYLKHIAYGVKRAGEGLCIVIERESDGKVRVETTRPDVDWAVIRRKAA